jgi:tetratricopeptide (TPR) repeat protein/tRNA A-37 threonylcarbamoyl transferase component Bud32
VVNASAAARPGEVRRALARGAVIDRFVVVALVGRGAMGEVYAAYDPGLDRKIAIKLLRPELTAGLRLSEARARLHREAQAIAKLSHPNVVVVHDVGTFGDGVFIAMEFVDGHTLTYWLNAQRRTRQEILQVFLQAGRGLAAAHQAGLVHRDFKPDNVMVCRDGQVRVMDFGLARPAASRSLPSRRAQVAALRAHGESVEATQVISCARPDSGPVELLDLAITSAGTVVGTPAYMSPEQCIGGPTDARSDQFSFCVALYEALYGERPFEARTVSGLRAALTAGEVRDPPAHANVPSWLRRALLRGLASSAAARFPSMTELLAALQADPAVRRRRYAALAALVACAAGFGFGLRQAALSDHQLCAAGPDKLAGVWEAPGGPPRLDSRRERIRRSFLSTGRGFAADAFNGVARALDSYTNAWTSMYRDACEATHTRGEQSAEVLDLRMACLSERLAGVKALTDVFVSADGVVVENAVAAAGALGSLDRCADVPLLRAVVRPPDDPRVRTRVDELRRRLPELKALADSGQCKKGLGPAREFLRQAREVGYSAVLAESLNVVAFLETECGDVREAERVLKQAVWTAEEAHHDQIAAEASVLIVLTVGANLGRVEEAEEWSEHARAAIRRMGGDKRLESWLLNGVGTVFYGAGRPGEALEQEQRAVALKREIYGEENQDVARSLTNVANALNDLGRHAEARAANDKALAIFEHTLGPDHPQVALVLVNLGEVLNALGLHDEARRAFERSLQIWLDSGAGDFYQAFSVTGLGESYLAQHRPGEARPQLERAVRMREASDPDPGRLGEARFALARALWPEADERPRARHLAEQARADYRRQPGARAKLDEITSWLSRHPDASADL